MKPLKKGEKMKSTKLTAIATTQNIENRIYVIRGKKVMLDNDLAKLFYRLGLIAYQNNHKELVLPLWTTMVNLSPEWSHFELELANYYLAAGNAREAKNTIEYCAQFYFPKEICLTFQNNEIQNNQPQPVGFMKDRIQTEVINN